ncbi:MAG TPA: adenylate/guanylate cyclase domain-containing protein [Candidatus Limnocylindria bacterium]|nr:adenylate/guanylate cyclase domain-containing protein [Candidatus Limnocylindria bacterium]
MRCPRCSTENPETAKFCSACGAALHVVRQAEGERRVVTVLFCDVKGSTALAESMDPEDWAEVMAGAFRALTAPIERYEGTVARVMGDAVLAYFGAPRAHEDDPVRAVLAALEMRREAALYAARLQAERGIPDLAVRIGINTGLAVLGDATGSGIEYTAMGDAVNVAARLQSAAEPGAIVVGDATRRQVEPFFELRPLGSLEVKGRIAPVPAFEVLARRAAATRSRVPFVGRAEALAVLSEALADVRAGRGRIVGIAGEAGIGKSRLIDELRAQWSASGGGSWAEARGQSYGAAQPYHLIRQQVLSACGASEDDPAATILAKVAGGLADAELGEGAVEVMLAVLGLVPEAALSGEALRDEIARVTEALVRRRYADGPGVDVFDDLHWSDPASIDLLARLLPLADELPVLFVLAYRPDRDSPAWRLRQRAETDLPHVWTEHALEPLSDAESASLLASLVPPDRLSDERCAQVLAKAEGNPLFIEELARALVDAGSTDVRLPESLHALVASRIDRLEEPARQALQAAAVVGRTFAYRVLRAVAGLDGQLDRQLSTLQRVDLVRETGREPERRFAFRHALTQEAAYRGILQRRRRELHRSVAETLLELYGDRLDEFSAEIGTHFAEAGDGRAVGHLAHAGLRAMRLYAIDDAIAHLGRALEVGRASAAASTTLATAYIALARSHELKSEFERALELYDEMERVAKEQGDVDLELAATARRAGILAPPTPVRDLERAERELAAALPRARERGDRAALARMCWAQMLVLGWRGHLEEARRVGSEGIAVAREVGDREILAFLLNDSSRGWIQSGDSTAGLEQGVEAIALFRELGNRAMLTDALATHAMARFVLGDLEAVRRLSDEASAIAEAIGNPWGKAFALFIRIATELEAGDWGRAIEVGELTLREGAKAGFVAVQVWPRSDLALAYELAGAPDRADAHLAAAYETAMQRMHDWLPVVVWRQAMIAARRGDLAAARRLRAEASALPKEPPFFQQFALDLPRAIVQLAEGDVAGAREAARASRDAQGLVKARPFTADFDVLIAEASLRLDDLPSAGEAIARGLEEARALGSKRVLLDLLLLETRLAERQGDPERARRARARAAEIARGIASSLERVGLAGSFRSRPDLAGLLSEGDRPA